MKKTYTIKNNQTLKFNEIKTKLEDENIKKDLMTGGFSKNVDIKKLNTWKYSEPKKLAESKVFNSLSKEYTPIRESEESDTFLNNLHFIGKNNKIKIAEINRYKKPNKEKKYSIEDTENLKGVKEEIVPYYLVQLKDTMEYLSIANNGQELLTKNKANAEMFPSKDRAKEAIERFIFDCADMTCGDNISDEDSFDSVEDFITESISDFIISPVYKKQLKEGLNHSITEVLPLKEKSMKSKLQDVAFYIVSIFNDSKDIMYVGKKDDDDEDFIAVTDKEDAEVFESESDAQDAINNMVYQSIYIPSLDSNNDLAELNAYEELSSKYRIDAVYVDISSLYFKPLKEHKQKSKKFGIRHKK